MANLLDGIQYRIPKVAFANTFQHWNEDTWQEWQDCGHKTVYSGRVEFRVKPVIEYTVTQLGTTTSKQTSVMTNRDTAMARVAALMDQGYEVSITRKSKELQTVAELLAARSVQWKSDNDTSWKSVTHFSGSVLGNGSISFRARPDYYWEVTVSQGISNSTITFDDPNTLAKYLEKYATTNNLATVVVKPVKYLV